MVGIGRPSNWRNVPRRSDRNSEVCSGVKVRRSLRSAPAQKALSEEEARTSARVDGVSEERVLWRDLTRVVERALRDCGRESRRSFMVPVCGAG